MERGSARFTLSFDQIITIGCFQKHELTAEATVIMPIVINV